MTRGRIWMRSHALLRPLALVLAVGAATAAGAQSAGRLSVSVEGVRIESGAGRCGIYYSPGGFSEQGREIRGAVAHINDWAGDLRVPRNSGGDLRGRRLPRRAQRGADRDRPVRQAEAGLRLLEQSILDVRAAELPQRGLRVQGRKPHSAGAAELLMHDPEKCAAVFGKDHAQTKS